MEEPKQPNTGPDVTPASRTDSGVNTNLSQPPRSAGEGTPASGFDLNNPTIISLLYLASYVTGITGLVGIVLAHVWESDAAEWEKSHYTYLIRTFWFGFLGFFVGGLLTILLIGFLVLPAVAVWVAVRSVLSLIRAQKREPMPDPKTLLF